MNSINTLGTSAASYLKKVPDELKVHKNPHLKGQSIERSNKSQVSHNQERKLLII